MPEDEEKIDYLVDKVQEIDERLQRVESELDENKVSEEPVSDPEENNNQVSSDRSSKTGDSSGSAMPSLEAELGLKWLGRVGIFAFVMGVVFSIRYAIQQDLIGYTTRIALGIFSGLGVGGLGWYAKEQLSGYERWGRTLMGGGAAITYFSVYASYHFQEYREAIGITLEQNLLMLTLVGLGIFTLAIRDESRVFAAEALTLSYATAYLGTGIGQYILLYVAILAAGVVALSYYKEWPLVHIYGILATFGMYLPSRTFVSYEYGLIFLTSMLLLFTASSLAMLHKKSQYEVLAKYAGIFSIYILPVIFAIYAHFEFLNQDIGQTYMIYFGIFVLQTLMYAVSENLEIGLKNHYLYSGTPFAVAGLLIYFSALWSAVALSVLAISAVSISLQLEREEIRYTGYLLSLTAATKAVFYDSMVLESLSFTEPLSSTRIFAFLAVIAGFTLMYVLIRANRETLLERESQLMERAYSWVLVLLVMVVVGLELTGFRLSILWAMYGVYLLALGINLRLNYFRKQSIAVLGLTTFKVFILDTSGLDTLSRTISFLMLGLILIAASYIYTNYRNELGSAVS